MNKKQKKAFDARINKLYGQFCSGLCVPIFDLNKICRAGEAVALAGGSDEEVGGALHAAARAVAVNEGGA